jgi:hypothetical protein
MKIKGKTTYQNLGMGFWGIIDEQGREWKPLNMPSELQKEDLAVEITAEEADEQMSIFMWGTAIIIQQWSIVN